MNTRTIMNEPRFSNYFIEKRGSSHVESLVTRGFPLFIAPDLCPKFFKYKNNIFISVRDLDSTFR